jgi:hypothetical protein
MSDSVRQVTAIPLLFRGTTIRTCGGPGKGTVEMDGSQWLPYQAVTFPTPPFPDYVSGHSTYSADPNGSTNSCGSAQTDENGAFEISQIPFGSIGVYAEAVRQGYWRDDEMARTQMVTLSAKAPTAHVALKIGPRPGELIVSVTDKTTGKAVGSFFVRRATWSCRVSF